MFQLVAKPAGTKAALKCNAEGNPAPEVKWYKNGVPILKDQLQKGGNVSKC